MRLQSGQHIVQLTCNRFPVRRIFHLVSVKFQVDNRRQHPRKRRYRIDEILRLRHARTVVTEEMIGADRNIAFLRFRKIVGKAGIYHGAPFRGFYKGKIQVLRGEDAPVDLPLIKGNVHTPHGVFRFRRIIEQNHAVINEQSRSPRQNERRRYQKVVSRIFRKMVCRAWHE